MSCLSPYFFTLKKGVINGDLTYDSSTGSFSVTATVNGTTNSTTNLSSAVSDAISASGLLSGLSATDSTTSITGTTSLTGNGGDNVLNLTGVNLNNATLTLNGGIDDYFIFNVSGDFFFSSSDVVLNGVTADHVIWNVLNVSTLDGYLGNFSVELKNSGTFNGTLLAPNRAISVDQLTVNGAIIGGKGVSHVLADIDKDNAGISIHSDATVNYVPFSPVPVPAAVWLFGSGLLGLVGMARRKKSA